MKTLEEINRHLAERERLVAEIAQADAVIKALVCRLGEAYAAQADAPQGWQPYHLCDAPAAPCILLFDGEHETYVKRYNGWYVRVVNNLARYQFEEPPRYFIQMPLTDAEAAAEAARRG